MKIIIEKFQSGTIRVKIDDVVVHTYLKTKLVVNSRLRRFVILRNKRPLASFPLENTIIIHK